MNPSWWHAFCCNLNRHIQRQRVRGRVGERRAVTSRSIYTQHHKMTLTVSEYRSAWRLFCVLLCYVVLWCHVIHCCVSVALTVIIYFWLFSQCCNVIKGLRCVLMLMKKYRWDKCASHVFRIVRVRCRFVCSWVFFTGQEHCGPLFIQLKTSSRIRPVWSTESIIYILYHVFTASQRGYPEFQLLFVFLQFYT